MRVVDTVDSPVEEHQPVAGDERDDQVPIRLGSDRRADCEGAFISLSPGLWRRRDFYGSPE